MKNRPLLVALVLPLLLPLALPLRAQEPQAQAEYFALMINDQKIGHYVEERRAAADEVTTKTTMNFTLGRGPVAGNRGEEGGEARADLVGLAGPGILERVGRTAQQVAHAHGLPERAAEEPDVDREGAGNARQRRATVGPVGSGGRGVHGWPGSLAPPPFPLHRARLPRIARGESQAPRGAGR